MFRRHLLGQLTSSGWNAVPAAIAPRRVLASLRTGVLVGMREFTITRVSKMGNGPDAT